MTKLLDLTVRELVENYSTMFSAECDYYYGIVSDDLAEKICKEYDLDDQVSVVFDTVIPIELEIENKEPLEWEKIEKILECIGIPKKGSD